jgi:hypothetical protein
MQMERVSKNPFFNIAKLPFKATKPRQNFFPP